MVVASGTRRKPRRLPGARRPGYTGPVTALPPRPGLAELFARARPERPLLALAPMEGVSDYVVRQLLSELGGMDLCVTEFIRVLRVPTPAKVLRRECPELTQGGRTLSGVPVVVQLLGGVPEAVAATAVTAVGLGALGVDLNFGCPARCVNGSDGGAALLRCPPRVTDVVAATRAAVPAHVPVSAKIRLGWDDPDDVVTLARAAEAGGAAWVTIHGRTKVQLYKPFADWTRIRRAADAVGIPVVANGDIFDPDALARCAEVTGATAFMLGRGAFRRPNLFRWMRGLDPAPWSAERCARLLFAFVELMATRPLHGDPQRVILCRLKQWVNAMREVYPELQPVFERLKRATELQAALHPLAELAPDAAVTAVTA
jgi:tRNA-dihydrouridine synthase C